MFLPMYSEKGGTKDEDITFNKIWTIPIIYDKPDRKKTGLLLLVDDEF